MVRQGDILLVPIQRRIDTKKLARIPREGGDVVLAHGESTGHRHRFTKRTTELCAPWPEKVTEPSARVAHARKLLASLPEIPFPADAAVIGIVERTAPDDLVHEEHSAIPHDAGQDVARRQCTYTPGRIEMVAD